MHQLGGHVYAEPVQPGSLKLPLDSQQREAYVGGIYRCLSLVSFTSGPISTPRSPDDVLRPFERAWVHHSAFVVIVIRPRFIGASSSDPFLSTRCPIIEVTRIRGIEGRFKGDYSPGYHFPGGLF